MQTHPCEIDQVVPRYELVDYPTVRTAPITLEMIFEDVCHSLNRSIAEVLSKSRKQELVICRVIFCYSAAMQTKFTLTEVGIYISQDHTTIIHSIRTVLKYLITGDLVFLEKWEVYLNNSKLFNRSDFNMQISPIPEQEKWLREFYKMYSNYHLSVKLWVEQRLLSVWIKHLGLSKRKESVKPAKPRRKPKKYVPVPIEQKWERPPASYGNTSWKEKVDQLLNDNK